jgi:membrane-associated phospholipid phosphatase
MSPARPHDRPGRHWPHGHHSSVFMNHPRTAKIALSATTGAVALIVLMAVPDTRAVIQRIDDRVFDFMGEARWTPFVWIGYAFNVLGGSVATVPIRIGMAAWLAARRLWWFLATFALAELCSELANTLLKRGIDRARPPDPLVHTTGASFPSGHAIAATVLALVLVTLFVPPGPRRRHWWLGATLFVLFMAASRAYLRTHWLSDAVGGVLIGAACVLDSAVVIQALRDRRRLRAVAKAPVAQVEAAEEMPEPGPLETTVEDEAGEAPRPEILD